MTDLLLKRLKLTQFTVFRQAEFEFVPGVNVFIGENGTGKTHLLKLMYAMVKPFDPTQVLANETPQEAKARFDGKLLAVFRPDDRQPGRLVWNVTGAGGANARLAYNADQFVDFVIARDGKLRGLQRSVKPTPRSVFVPPRDVLAIYEGFAAAYENRELAFDETYYDLCRALSASPLKSGSDATFPKLLPKLARQLGVKARKRGGRFYLAQKGHREVEAHLMAEGLRKVATLYRLMANGGLRPGDVLFLDEPEASLNPKLVGPLVNLLHILAQQGVQVFISTHDFLLSQELSLAAEYKTWPEVPIRFFGLSDQRADGVIPHAADTLPELADNAIVREFAAHYDREQVLFSRPTAKAKGARGADGH